ncbi:MAG TPA: energy transducer TonB [Allosphingosinicella sp.]
MRKSGLVIAAAAALACSAAAQQPPAAPAAAVPQAELDRFEQAFATDPRATTQILDALTAVRARVPATLRPDPLLSGLAGRLYLQRGWIPLALAYLRHADAPEVPRPQRIQALLALAEAQGRSGDGAAAAATLRRIEALSPSPAERRRAALLSARFQVASAPRAALEAIQPLLADANAADRFEAEFIAAQAQSLLGDGAAAQAAADRMWASAGAAPASLGAPVRAALLRAALAEQRGDLEAQAAMLNVAAAQSVQVGSALARQLPVCGDGGLRPEDRVTFGLIGRGGEEELVPLTASRPAIAQLFLEPLMDVPLLRLEGRPDAGVTIAVRCRRIPSIDYRDPPRRSGFAEWFADRGLFFTLTESVDLEDIAALSRRVGEMEERLGGEDAQLIAARLDLSAWIAARAEFGDVDLEEAYRLHDSAIAAMRRIGGVERALPPAASDIFRRRMMESASSEETMRLAREVVPGYLAGLPVEDAFDTLQLWLAGFRDTPNDLATSLVQAMLARLPASASDPRRRAMLMRLGQLQAEAGDRSAARASYRAAGVPADACLMMDQPASHVSGTIVNDDYPARAVRNSYAGSTTMEYDVGADGAGARMRVILSVPSGVFDPVTEVAFQRFRFAPARHGGRARACAAQTRQVRWRLPADAPGLPPPGEAPPIGDRI